MAAVPRRRYATVYGKKKQPAAGWFGEVFTERRLLFAHLRFLDAGPKIINKLKRIERLSPIGILHWVGVKPRYRGHGYGNVALQQFLKWATNKGCRYAILEADADGKQKEGFKLVKWYKAKGFIALGRSFGNRHVIMLKPLRK